jgi:hypothetical protein
MQGLEKVACSEKHYRATVVVSESRDWVSEGDVMFHKCLTPKSVTIRSYMQQK